MFFWAKQVLRMTKILSARGQRWGQSGGQALQELSAAAVGLPRGLSVAAPTSAGHRTRPVGWRCFLVRHCVAQNLLGHRTLWNLLKA